MFSGDFLKGKEMKMLSLFFIFSIFPSTRFVFAEDENQAILSMTDAARHAVQIEVLESQCGTRSELGTDWFFLCKIKEVYKGEMKEGDLVRIYVKLFDYKRDEKKSVIIESNRLVEKKEAIVFLTGLQEIKVRFSTDGELKPTYFLSDRWLGVLEPNAYLADWLTNYSKNNASAKTK